MPELNRTLFLPDFLENIVLIAAKCLILEFLIPVFYDGDKTRSFLNCNFHLTFNEPATDFYRINPEFYRYLS